jgi:branched-chain amino acid transport system substrate-binding protein
VAFTLYSIHQQGYKYLFSPYPKTPNSIKTLFEMLDTLPPKERPSKMAIFQLTTDWGIEQAEAIQKMAPPGYEIAMNMKYRPLTKDFSAMILKAKAAGADSLWSNPIPPDGIALLRQSKELNWNPKFLYVVRAATYTNWIKALGSYPFKGNKAFVSEFKKRDKVLPDTTAGAGYVSVQILANAIERSGTLKKEKIRDAIASTDMMTIMGPIRFEADGTPKMYGPDGKILAIGGMSQWINGKQELVWPPNLATAPLAYPAKAFRNR